MRYNKLGLKVLGSVVLAILGTMAFTAGAQGQTHTEKLHQEALHNAVLLPGASTLGGFWIESPALPGGALLATVTGWQSGAGNLLVQGRNLTLECASGSVINGKIHSSTDALGTFLFSECVAWNFAQSAKLPCTVLTPGEPTGSAAIDALMLPILHGGATYVLLEPIGLNLSTLELHGATCPLPLVNPVKGSITAEITTNHILFPLLKFSSAVQLLTDDTLTFGGFVSYIDASIHISLTGEHAGDGLGVL